MAIRDESPEGGALTQFLLFRGAPKGDLYELQNGADDNWSRRLRKSAPQHAQTKVVWRRQFPIKSMRLSG